MTAEQQLEFDPGAPWLGIDFGTCRTAAAVLVGDEPHMVTLGFGGHGENYDMPTAVFVEADGSFRVGDEAVRTRAKDDSRYFDRFKLRIGSSRPFELLVNGAPKSFVYADLVLAVLRRVKSAAEAQYNNERPLQNVILSVPAIYSEGGPEWTVMLEAARHAGFRAPRIVREPEAAALYYEHLLRKSGSGDRDAHGKVTLVYDLGGGTFDPALIRRLPEGYRVEGAMPGNGIKCGGIFFDEALTGEFRRKCPGILEAQFRNLRNATDNSIPPEHLGEARRQGRDWIEFQNFIREVKHSFAVPEVRDVSVPEPLTYSVDFQLTRPEFDALIGPLLDLTIDCTRSLIESSRVKWEDITRILMVGGSCHLPLVRDKLQRMIPPGTTGVEICWQNAGNVKIDPKHCVALGAALSLDAVTMTELAVRYGSGRGVEKNLEKAFDWYRKAAERGYPRAQYLLAMRILQQEGTPQNMTDEDRAGLVRFWMERAGRQGMSEAWEILGALQLAGKLLPKDEQKAAEALAEGAALGDAQCQYDLALLYADGVGVPKNARTAFELLELAARQDHAEACREVAECYSNGRGVTEDDTQAAKWYRAGAELGDASSQFSMGIFTIKGYGGVPVSTRNGAQWVRRAAEQGLAAAQNYLGVLLDAGTGVDADPAEAVVWYLKAAEQGHAQAQENVALSYRDGTGVKENPAEAFRWFLAAAEQGLSRSQNQVGLAYEAGRGIPVDAPKAAQWFRKSAEQGFEWGQYNLGAYLLSQGRSETEKAEGLTWLMKAADQKNLNALMDLGSYFWDREDYPKSMKYYEAAADLGDAVAMTNIALLQGYGVGVPKNRSAARSWLCQAAEAGYPDALPRLINLWVAQELAAHPFLGRSGRFHIYNGQLPAVFGIVREVYRLREEVKILGVWDDTVFLGGKDGFVITSHGMGFKDMFVDPVFYSFDELFIDDVEKRLNQCGNLAADQRASVASFLAYLALQMNLAVQGIAGIARLKGSSPLATEIDTDIERVLRAPGHAFSYGGVCVKCYRARPDAEASGPICNG